MKNLLMTFWADEDGATVVDMTMLMAAIVGLCLAVSVQVSNGMESATDELSNTVSGIQVGPAWE